MSEDEGARRTGYKNPPSEHQFKKGQSGNPKGRPPKAERSFTPRQFQRDMLKLTEETVIVITDKGKKHAPRIEVIYRKLLQKAAEGHGPSMRFVIDMHKKLVENHFNANKERFGFLEMWEESELDKPTPPKNKHNIQKL